MARTIEEIKKEMTGNFVANDTIRAVYGLENGKEFDAQFSKVSIESILFYVVAVAVWTLEKLFDRHRQETADLINELKPHSARWYANKAKAFQFGRILEPDSDRYDNTGVSDEDVRGQQVVKYAAVTEKEAIVYIKVATGEEGARKQLTSEQEDALNAYFNEVKDAGVKLEIVNNPAEEFNLEIDIYYDPQVFNSNLVHNKKGTKTVHDAIAAFVENLPFNGEYRNSALINTLTGLDGVVMVELKRATANGQAIDAWKKPGSGYFKVNKDQLNIKAIPYGTKKD